MADRYKRPRIRLVFSDEEFDGLIVECRRLTNDQMLDIVECAGRMSEVDQADTSAMRKAMRELAEVLVPAIVWWNLDDERDVPVPVSSDGLYRQDTKLLLAVANEIQQTIAGVSDFLPPNSAGGLRSLAELEPTER